MWNDALRVAKFHGGQSAHKRVAYAWALALGGDAGAKLLNKQVRLPFLPLFFRQGSRLWPPRDLKRLGSISRTLDTP